MSDLRELYQEVILDHYRRPRNFREAEGDARRADGFNPLCGDRVTVFLVMDGDIVRDVSFKGVGCAISTASASLMTEALKGKTRAEAETLFTRFHDMITGPGAGSAETESLGKLAVFSGVRDYPVRVKCATLAWHAFHAALEGRGEPVSTE
jgi:nitrogen fixation NifU-like protein